VVDMASGGTSVRLTAGLGPGPIRKQARPPAKPAEIVPWRHPFDKVVGRWWVFGRNARGSRAALNLNRDHQKNHGSHGSHGFQIALSIDPNRVFRAV